MTKNVKQIINKLENETDFDELYSILIDCGKNHDLNGDEKRELEAIIYKYCDHKDPIVRSGSISVLCFYWGLEKYRDKAFEMSENKSEFSGTRADALRGWANTYRNQNEKSVINSLVIILKNKNTDDILRATAYGSIFVVSNLPPKDWPNTNIEWDDFDKQVDWKLLAEISIDL